MPTQIWHGPWDGSWDGRSQLQQPPSPSGGVRHGGSVLDVPFTLVATDTFTDTPALDLSLHTPDSGGSWSEPPAYSGYAVISDADRLRQDSAASSLWLIRTPDGTDSWDLGTSTTPSPPSGVGVVARWDATTRTGLVAYYDSTALQYTLSEYVDGAETVLGTYPSTPDAASTHTLALMFVGASVRMLVDDVAVTSYLPTSVTGGGHTGIVFGDLSVAPADGTGIDVDNFNLSLYGDNSFLAYGPNPPASGGMRLGAHSLEHEAYGRSASGGMRSGGSATVSSAVSSGTGSHSIWHGAWKGVWDGTWDGWRGALPSGSMRYGGSVLDVPFTLIATDTFTDTPGLDLSLHTPDAGGSWSLPPAYSGYAVISDADRLRQDSAASSLWLIRTPDGTDSWDLGTISTPSPPSGVGVVARWDATTQTGLVAYYDSTALQYTLSEYVDGAETMLGAYPSTPDVASTHTLALMFVGASVRMLVDDVAVTEYLATSVTSGGHTGVVFGDLSVAPPDGTGIDLDNFNLSLYGDDSFLAYDASPATSGGMRFGGSAHVGLRASPTASGGMRFGGSAHHGPDSTSETPSGGMRLGGSASAALRISRAEAGGMRLGGSASARLRAPPIASGGLRLGGSANASVGVRVRRVASGGMRFGGRVLPLASHATVPAGGISYGGHTTYAGTGGASITAIGGMRLGGRPRRLVAYHPDHSGGILYGGKTSRTTGVVRAASGGISYGGHVPSSGSTGIRGTGGIRYGGEVAGGKSGTGLIYNVYANTGISDHVSYLAPVYTTNMLSYTPPPLAYPCDWSFHVRAEDVETGEEEKNLDARLRIVIDSAGVDITGRPSSPTKISVFQVKGGVIRVQWTFVPRQYSSPPTKFNVYAGTPTINYAVPVTNVGYVGSGSYSAIVSGLTADLTYQFGVRAYNAVAEDPNAEVVSATIDGTGPAPPDNFMISAI